MMVTRKDRHFSLYWRLTGSISLVLLAGAGVLSCAAWINARTAADNAYDRLLVGAARQISETISADGGAVTVDLPVSALETLSISRSDRVFYQVAAPDGTIVTGYEDLPGPGEIEPSDNAHVGDEQFRNSAIRVAWVWRYLAEQGATGWVRVTVAQTREARNILAWELTLGGLVPALAMSGLALAALMAAVHIGLRLLRRVERALLSRDPNDLTPLDLEAPVEVDALIDAINRFMKRLSARLGAMQRYIETSAHQLRTPLTGIAAQVELLEGARDDGVRAETIARLRRRVSEAGRLANQLLSHATVIHRAEAVLADTVDLRQVAQHAVADSVLETLARDLTVRVDAPQEPVPVLGDFVALREALHNLVDNALRHGAPSRLTVRIGDHDGHPMLAVHDDGPGIAASDWDKLLERFVRGDTMGGGTGLGLAIVADVARTHKARLSLLRAANGDFGIAMIFPERTGR